MMSDQMALLPHLPPKESALKQARPPWELDERTREAGRRGLAAARLALRQASGSMAA